MRYLSLIVEFVLGMASLLTFLEAIHMMLLGQWNSEIFAAITGLLGTVTGIFTTLIITKRRE